MMNGSSKNSEWNKKIPIIDWRWKATHSNLCISTYTKIQNNPPSETSNNLTIHIRVLETQKVKSKISRWEEIIKIRTEINETEAKITQRCNEMESWPFEKLNKIDNHLDKLSKRTKAKTQINKIRGGKWDITTDANEVQKIIRA